jgi:predicted nucleic acid-binding protein
MPSFVADTNVILRSIDPGSPHHPVATEAIATLLRRGDLIVLTAQILIEFWAVATRPRDVNGFGWSVERTSQEIAALRAQFPLLTDSDEVFPRWIELVNQHQLMGKRVHDARLIAVMKVHHISRLVTFNHAHFACFQDIELFSPHQIIGTT